MIAGGASVLAARKVRAKLKTIASRLLEAASDDIVLENGAARGRRYRPRRADRRRWRAPPIINRIGSRARSTPGLSESATYDPAGTFSNACHAAIVEVDAETGHVTIERFVIAEDAGRLVNPMIADGQVMGGVAQGIGNALLEEIVYDDTGNMLTATLADFLPPTCARNPADRAACTWRR